MKFRKVLAVVSALCMMCAIVPFLKRSVTDDVILSASAIEDGTCIYRTSVEGKCEGISTESFKWDFVFTLMAYESGHIHIDIQCKNVNSTWTCNQIGSIQFDDSMIAPVGEEGFAGISSFNNYDDSNAKYMSSFSGTNIVYTMIYSDYDQTSSGKTIMSFDLFVKQNYLGTHQKFSLFNTEIEIPFNQSAIIEEDDDITYMKENQITLDFNNNGIIDSADAARLLKYAAAKGAGTVRNLKEFLEKEES